MNNNNINDVRKNNRARMQENQFHKNRKTRIAVNFVSCIAENTHKRNVARWQQRSPGMNT